MARGSGVRSRSTVANSAAAMPSAMEWWSFSMSAIRPSSRPSMKVSSQRGRLAREVWTGSRRRVEGTRSRSLVPVPDIHHMTGDVERGVVDQTGGASFRKPGLGRWRSSGIRESLLEMR